ncbi:MAG: agmatinase [candidate division WOR-3 bacterium]
MRFYFARADYKAASFIILGIPFDRTSSFLPGTRFAVNNVRLGAENIETFSPYQNLSLPEDKIFDAGDLLPEMPPEEFFKLVEERVSSFLSDKKKVLSIGGEHTISLPCVQAYKKFYPDLILVHLDAHSDMRDEYLGEKICHATVMRRIQEVVGEEGIFSFGIRSLTEECRKRHKNLYPFRVLEPLLALKERLRGRPIYLTLDLDILDGCLFPAVSTPEPNGIFFAELLAAIKELAHLTLVGADIVEYNPLSNPSLAYAVGVSLLVREIILAYFNRG